MIIPRIFHRAWVGGKAMPIEFENYWRGWQERHPDWGFFTWHDHDIDRFGLQNRAEYDSAEQAAGKTDIAMFEILRRFGGVWLCCDMECFRNIEPLIQDVDGFCGRQMADELLGAIMGFVPNHPLLNHLVDGIPESVKLHQEVDLCAVAGPVYLTRTAEAFFGKPARDIVEEESIRVLDSELVYPYLWMDEYQGQNAYPKAYCAHHWAGSWH